MIGGLCKKGSLSEADMLFKKMGEEDGTAPSECSGVATSVELIEEMKRCGFAADASTMKMVIDMLSDEGLTGLSRRILFPEGVIRSNGPVNLSLSTRKS
ncbi:hypothetical protein YC2023_100779 [Brassica napus]